jgi:hypothetical protein
MFIGIGKRLFTTLKILLIILQLRMLTGEVSVFLEYPRKLSGRMANCA